MGLVRAPLGYYEEGIRHKECISYFEPTLKEIRAWHSIYRMWKKAILTVYTNCRLL